MAPLRYDAAVDVAAREQDSELLDRAEVELEDVERALARLEEGSYLACEACGQPIGEERLAILPLTRRCAQHELARTTSDPTAVPEELVEPLEIAEPRDFLESGDTAESRDFLEAGDTAEPASIVESGESAESGELLEPGDTSEGGDLGELEDPPEPEDLEWA